VTAKGEHELGAAGELLLRIREIAGADAVDLFPLSAGEWESADGTPEAAPQGSPLVVTSVAEPASFVELVRRRTGGIRGHLAFPDHHLFSEEEVRRIRNESREGWVATTEKDAVKLIAHRELLPELRVLPLVAAPSQDIAERLLDRIELRCREVRGG
jgi:tetraacyldisaccharide 4'-kinase